MQRNEHMKALRLAIARSNARSRALETARKNTEKYFAALRREKNAKIKNRRFRPTLTPLSVQRRTAFRTAVKSPAKPNLRRHVLLKSQAIASFARSMRYRS